MAWLSSEAITLIMLRNIALHRVSKNSIFFTVTLLTTACCLPICSGGLVIQYGRWLVTAIFLLYVVLNVLCCKEDVD